MRPAGLWPVLVAPPFPGPTRSYIRRMNEDGTAYSFRCPNLDCEAQYVAIPKDHAPDKKPRLATATRTPSEAQGCLSVSLVRRIIGRVVRTIGGAPRQKGRWTPRLQPPGSGGSLFATASVAYSLVSRAIFWASITSPGTKYPRGTTHQPVRGTPSSPSS
jgi:hypothetical protein